MTSIEWTDTTWNPITGCTKISAGCRNCYAEGIAKRFWGDRAFSDVQFHSDRLLKPFSWKKPRMVFVNSMSDLFHEQVTDEQIDQIFALMALTPQHTYQVLTKRPQRMLEYCQMLDLRRLLAALDFAVSGNYKIKLPLPNAWLGVTVENQKAVDRIPLLLQTPAAVRFLSCEPLLEGIDISKWLQPVVRSVNGVGYLNGGAITGTNPNAQIDWVIVGGESGPGARPCELDWIKSIVNQCRNSSTPCFVKQLGSNPLDKGDRWTWGEGKNSDISKFPTTLQVRDFPQTA